MEAKDLEPAERLGDAPARDDRGALAAERPGGDLAVGAGPSTHRHGRPVEAVRGRGRRDVRGVRDGLATEGTQNTPHRFVRALFEATSATRATRSS